MIIYNYILKFNARLIIAERGEGKPRSKAAKAKGRY